MSRLPVVPGRSPLLRLQSDERLIALTRRGNPHAFEALVQRYQARLHAFCRHMLGSTEDAEDVLQEVFAAAFNAILGDERSINVRPWLYRIARNRCLNHLRRPVAAGQDSMDVFERDGGTTTADTVHKREEFRQIVRDVQDLPETQRTALLLREIDALSYDQIAEAMDNTVPSVKSLLVRARVSLAEAAEARLLSCEEVRVELGEVAEGLKRTTAPVRRHLKACDRCRLFRVELRRANRALAAVYPIGPLVAAKVLLSKVLGGAAGGSSATGSGAGAGAASGASVAGAGATAGGAGVAGGGATAGGFLGVGATSIATKAAAGFAAAALVTAGAAEVRQVTTPSYSSHAGQSGAVAHPHVAFAVKPPVILPSLPPHPKAVQAASAPTKAADAKPAAKTVTPPASSTPVPAKPATAPPPAAASPPPSSPAASSSSSPQPQPNGQTQQDSSTVTLQQPDSSGSGSGSSGSGNSYASGASGQSSNAPPGEPASAPPGPSQSGPPGEPAVPAGPVGP